MKRESMIIYRSFFEAIKDLPKENQAEVWNAIFEYGLDFKEPKLKGISNTIFTLIKPQLDANINRYNNGSKPKQKISKTEAKNKQKISKEEANVNDNVNNNKNNTFIKPSLQEVLQYCIERNNKIDAYQFINFYDSKGWMVGRNKMKDWKACVRTWEKSSLELPKQQKSNDQLFYENVMKQVNLNKQL
jgi:hypothetical protein